MTRELYDIYMDELTKTMEGAWIWRLIIQPRVCLFIWKVAWGWLPTRALLRARGMDILASYPCCGFEEETLDHALFHCPRARQVWCLAISSKEPSVKTFMEGLQWSSESHVTGDDGVKVAYIAY